MSGCIDGIVTEGLIVAACCRNSKSLIWSALLPSVLYNERGFKAILHIIVVQPHLVVSSGEVVTYSEKGLPHEFCRLAIVLIAVGFLCDVEVLAVGKPGIATIDIEEKDCNFVFILVTTVVGLGVEGEVAGSDGEVLVVVTVAHGFHNNILAVVITIPEGADEDQRHRHCSHHKDRC
jgi:hypothetical protein